MEIDIQLKGDGTTIDDEVRLAVAAEDAGFGRVWHSEGYREAVVPLTAITLSTRRIGVGSAIMQWTRSLPNMELTAAALQELAEGRFVLGIGTAPPKWNENWHGIEWSRPLRRMREYVEAIRLMWTASIDDPVSFAGDFFTVNDYYRFAGPNPLSIPIFLGVTQPGMARLAGEIADGAIFNSQLSASYIGEVIRPIVEDAHDKSGRVGTITFAATTPTAVSQDRQQAMQWVRHDIAMHFGVAGYFGALADHHGLGEERQRIQSLFEAGERERAIAAVTDEMVNLFGLAGTPDEVREKVRQYEGVLDRIALASPAFMRSPVDTVRNYEAIIETFAR